MDQISVEYIKKKEYNSSSEIEDLGQISEICKKYVDMDICVSNDNYSLCSNNDYEEKIKYRKKLNHNRSKKCKFECPICFIEYTNEEYITTLDCEHKYCIECIRYYVSANINARNVQAIKCPSPQCKYEIQYFEISKIIDEITFEKYDRFLCYALLEQDETCKWCPNPGCGNAIIANPEKRLVICNECSHEFCYFCYEPYHTGTCDEYKEWKLENENVDKKFKQWKKNKEDKRKCPKCKIYITKTEGCNHIQCTNCYYQFCWLCGGRYTNNHFSAYNIAGCPFLKFSSKSGSVIKRIALKTLIGTGYVIGGCIALPLCVPIFIVGGPIFIALHQYRKNKKRNTIHWQY